MDTDRELSEIVARCISLVVYYHNCGRTARAREVFEADVALVAEWVERAGVSERTVGHDLVSPVLAGLVERYDRPHAFALVDEFIAALRARESSPEASGEHLAHRG